jgi:lysophospholipid acyltransferase 1/2
MSSHSDLRTLYVAVYFREIPNVLEYFSYIFCFHTLNVGPFVFYKDYKQFIDGEYHQKAEKVYFT